MKGNLENSKKLDKIAIFSAAHFSTIQFITAHFSTANFSVTQFIIAQHRSLLQIVKTEALTYASGIVAAACILLFDTASSSKCDIKKGYNLS